MTGEQASRSLPSATEELVESIVSQATVQIDKEHNAFVVACGISFDSVEVIGDRRAEWHHKYDLEPHVRAMLLRDLCGYNWTTLHTTLETDDRAQTLGYDPEKFPEGSSAPHRTTLSRAWNEYFGEKLRRSVEEASRRIREYARKSGTLIGRQRVDPESNEDASRRTKYRVKRQTAHEMAAMFRRVFYDELDLNLPEDADYEKADLLDLFLHMALTGDFANNGADVWAEEVDDDETAPSGDTLRRYIRMFDELDRAEVSAMFEEVTDLLWQMADRRGFLDGYVDTAIDEHAWRFYGQSDTPRISDDVDPERGTDKAYRFLTLSVVSDEGERFVIGARQVTSKQEKLEAMKELVELADERLFIRNVLLDRGFYGTMYAQTLKETGVNFVIRAQAGTRSKTLWEEADEGVNIERTTMSRSYAPYVSVDITRFVVPAKDEMEYDYVAFITNRELTRRKARRIGEMYRRRWGIETSYRVTGDFLPKTASKDFALRQFYYQMAVLLYNTWVIVNAVVAESIGYPADESPLVTAKYLLVILRNKHDEQGIP